MRNATVIEGRKCPVCGSDREQRGAGFNRSGTQRCYCKACGKYYTLESKTREYTEETRQEAMRIYYSGVSGRGVGKLLHMHHANVVKWIKKNRGGVDKPAD